MRHLRRPRYNVIILTICGVLALLLSACTEKSGTNDPNGNTDTTPPTVISTSPTNTQTNVPVGTNISIIFSEEMNPSTIAASTITISGGVVSTLSYANQTVTLDPTTNLNYSTTYTITVTSAVKDEAGNPMATQFSFTFTTEVDVNGPPTVVATTPSDGSRGFPVNGWVKATFSKDMNATTINQTSFSISPSTPGMVSYSNRVATFIPASPFEFNREYTAFLLNTIADTAGNHLTTYTWSFWTVQDVIMPLDDGRRWVGSWIGYDTFGNANTPSIPDTIRIESTTVVGDSVWYVNGTGWLLRNKADGLWRIKNIDSVLYLQYPATPGIPYTVDAAISEKVQVLDADTLITVPAGQYNCVLYKWFTNDVTDIKYFYYAPQVGPVMIESFYDRTDDPLKIKTRWRLFQVESP